MSLPMVKIDPEKLKGLTEVRYEWGKKMIVVTEVSGQRYEIDLGFTSATLGSILKRHGAEFAEKIADLLFGAAGIKFDKFSDVSSLTTWFRRGR